MKRWAGYYIDWDEFWKYYRETSKADYSQYRQLFQNSISKGAKSYGLYESSNYVNNVGDHLTGICKVARTNMLSNGASAQAVKHIMDKFKKWLFEYYA